MTWLNPVAWFGLISLAVPVIIHLLGRHRARVQRFPTLRFIAPSRLIPVRRARISDWPLLIVRMLILLVAVAALARPFLRGMSQRSNQRRAMARVIVIDTSASMTGRRPAASAGVDVARSTASRLAGDGSAARIIETATPASALRGAVAWLETQSAKGQIAVISDFQVGTIDSIDIATVPKAIGISLIRVNGEPTASTAPMLRYDRRASTTDAEWTNAIASSRAFPMILAGPAEVGRAEAARQAVISIAGAASSDSSRPVAIIYGQYSGRAALLARSANLSRRWMGDLVTRVAPDPSTLVRQAQVDGRETLLLFPADDAGSFASASLISRVMAALAVAPAGAEENREVTPDARLAAWGRPAGDVVAPIASGRESDGRWLWAVALLLLLVETAMRRPAFGAGEDESTPLHITDRNDGATRVA